MSFDQKPEDGCEIWTLCDGRSGMILHLKLVKTQTKQDEQQALLNPNENLNHGTEVALDLVSPWFCSQQLVCADSYVSSVQTAWKCKEKGLKYIGVVKTATRHFPMQLLGSCLEDKGERYGLVANDANDQPELLSFVSLDHRYFIASGSLLAEGEPQQCELYQQIVRDRNTGCSVILWNFQ
jgi:Transposase IS4